MNVTTGTRNTVFQRDSFQCIHCGSMRNLTLRQRSHTGNGSAENLITMCSRCDEDVDKYTEFSDLAMNYGWKLRTWEEPDNRAVYYQQEGYWWFLTERGTRIRAGETADG